MLLFIAKINGNYTDNIFIAEERLDPFTLYKPQTQKECDLTVELIKNKL